MKKHMIWTSDIGSLKDWKDFINDQIDEGYLNEDCSEEEKRKAIYEMNERYLEDERDNLDIPVEGRILIIADLGLWDGRRSAYAFASRNNINAILQHPNCYDIEFFCDGYNIKSTVQHHDGVNHYEYREVRKDMNIDNLLDKLYSNKPVSRKMINRYTCSLAPKVKEVYGW